MRSRPRARTIADGTTALPSVLAVAAAVLTLTACSSKGTSVKVRGQTTTAAVPTALIGMVSPSRLVPDIRNERGVVAYESGARRALVNRMRVVTYDDGTVDRAAELLPVGNVHAVALPNRLGGGFVFHASTGGATQIWRASSWLGKLTPLVQFGTMATDLVPGFDRIYIRLSENSKLLAIDPETGESRSVAPLPPAAAYGALAVADGFRAVVDVDMRGVLATFDAGATWRPLGLSERPTAIAVVDGDPTIFVAQGRYVLDARGNSTFRSNAVAKTDDEGVDTKLPAPRGPFGKRPLRAAVEDGFPDSNDTAVVARSGALARISLRSGGVVEMSTSAYPERDASCHAVRLGASYGFVCGERDGATNVYAFDPPLAMRKVLSFRGPRFVSASGNGALVIRGPCGEGPEDEDGMRVYCVRSAEGNTREVRVKGDLGVERVVALRDGRVVILVPPRNGGTGQITFVDGSSVATIPLSLPAKPRSVARELARGMWLEGFEERDPGVMGGWVESGGPVIGVRVALDGKVTAGEPRNNENGVIMSGRFALSQGEGGRAAESTDGGVTWKVFDMPEHDIAPGDADTRACGPLGCVLGGWVRVGWGKPATTGDLSPATTPPSMYVPSAVSPTVSMRCTHVGKATTEPLPDKLVKPVPAPVAVPSIPTGPFGRFPLPSAAQPKSPWQPFRNAPAPTIGADEVGIDNGVPYDLVSMRAYAWGKKGADWARLGHFVIRFDDRFDPAGGMRSTGIAPPPWPDEVATMDAMGVGSYPIATWGSHLDSSGRHALITLCRGGSCTHLAASEGQPALSLHDASGRAAVAPRPYPHGAVRLGESWFFVGPGPSSDTVALYRADLGVIHRLAIYHRPVVAPGSRYSSTRNAEPPRLVRRAVGTGIGFLFTATAAPGERSGPMFVLPIDPDTGGLAEPVLLGKRDLGGQLPPRCAEGQDGWLMDTMLDMTPNVQITSGRAALDTIEFRLRMDPGAACVEAAAARIDGLFVPDPDAKPNKPSGTVTLAATERMTGRRWTFTCAKP